jgi:hypothetical protein
MEEFLVQPIFKVDDLEDEILQSKKALANAKAILDHFQER